MYKIFLVSGKFEVLNYCMVSESCFRVCLDDSMILTVKLLTQCLETLLTLKILSCLFVIKKYLEACLSNFYSHHYFQLYNNFNGGMIIDHVLAIYIIILLSEI